MTSNQSIRLLQHKCWELTQEIQGREKDRGKIYLTRDHLSKFAELFKSLTDLNHPEWITERVFTVFEEIIQKCDSASSHNRLKLLHLSYLILNHLPSDSIHWILAIYKRMIHQPPETFHRFTCIDITKVPLNPDSYPAYAETLVKLMAFHVRHDSHNEG